MTKRRFISSALSACIAIAAGVIASCTLGPNYTRPAVEIPATYKSASTENAATQGTAHLATNWWLLFNDPILTDLEETSRRDNFDLKVAAAKIAEARATARQVKSQFYPQITFDPAVTATFRPNVSPGTATQIPFDLGYEIDIWGHVARSLEAANAATRATADQYAVVEQTLEADVAEDYINLRAFEAQDAILQENVEKFRKQIDLTKEKQKVGIVGNIDVAQAQSELDQLIPQQVDIHRQRTDMEHALAILTGKPPAEFSVPEKGDPLVPPPIPAELPAEILRHRPDVVEAEENLIAANANVGVALTNFYPTIHLSGVAGYESVSVQNAFDWQSALLSIGPSASLPIFEGGKLEGALQQAQAQYDELVATYRSTILGAFRDVEVSLNDVHMYSISLDAQHRAVESAQKYYDLSEVEYKQGIVSYLQLLDADRTLLTSQQTESQIAQQRLVSTVLLIKALGGGWTPHTKHQAVSTLPSTTRAAE